MKKLIAMIGTFFLIALLPLLVLAKSGSYGGTHSFSSSHVGTGAKSEHEYVSGYTKNNGTHVNGYDRSTRDDTKNNNWSTKGNTNPETGKAGTKSGD